MTRFRFVLTFLWVLPFTLEAQHVLKTNDLTVPEEQSEELDVLLDPWSGLGADSMIGDGIVPRSTREQEGSFYVDLQFRGRGEYRNGQSLLRQPSAKPAWFVGDRARLSMGYKRGILSAKVSGQHTGVWGDGSLEGRKGNFSMHEAWARLESRKGWFLQAGRQVLSYDDERIFGEEDWLNTGYTHDAVRLGYDGTKHQLHGIVSFSQQGEKVIGDTYYAGAVPYKNLQFLWYHFGNENMPFQFSVMGLNQGLEIGYSNQIGEKASTGYMQTVGAWLQFKKNGLFGKAEGYYQLGHDENQRKMDAYMAAARFGYEGAVWGVTIGGDYLSGTVGTSGRGTNNTFKLLFGSDHDFYGTMDYFTRERSLTCGLIDGVGKVYVRPVKKFTISADYHYFATGVKRPRLHRPLGQEIDVHLRYDVLKDVAIEAGYSTMLPTSVMVYFQGGGSTKSWQDWGWISLNVSPRIFTSKR